jgi:hypothetical protein
VIAIAMIASSVAQFQAQIPNMTNSVRAILDKSLPQTLKVAAQESIPRNETVVISTNMPHFIYFTGYNATVPWGVDSQKSLVNYMHKGKFNYLVVFENNTSEPKLKSVFSSKGLKSLNSDFAELSVHRSDLSVVHVYRLKS